MNKKKKYSASHPPPQRPEGGTDFGVELLNDQIESVNEFAASRKSKGSKRLPKNTGPIGWALIILILLAALYFVVSQIRITEFEYDKSMKAVVQSECYVKPNIPPGPASSSRDCLVQLDTGQKILISMRWNNFPEKGDIVTIRRYTAKGIFSTLHKYKFTSIER